MELDINKLKNDLKSIYKTYLVNPEDETLKNKAGELYNTYKDLDPILKPEISFAIRKLVDISFDTGLKISPDEIKKILNDLKNAKS